MKKLIYTLIILLGSLSFVACGKKKDNNANNSCAGYPAGYVRVTDQRMLQYYNGGGYNQYGGQYGNYNNQYNQYNNQYNNQYQYPQQQQQQNVVCVDQQTYNMLSQQANGGGGNGYPNYPNQPNYPTNNDPYCDYFPQDPYCWYGNY